MRQEDISWNIENPSTRDDFLHTQNEIFKKFNVLNNSQITQLFLDKNIDRDVFNDIYNLAENVCKLNYIENNEDSVESILAIILLKACDGSINYWTKIDKIEYYSRFFKWTLRNYIKRLRSSSSNDELIKLLIDSSVNTMNSYVDNKVNLITTIKETHNYYQRVVEDWNNDPCFSKLWQDRDFANLSWEGDKTAFFCLYTLDKSNFINEIEKFKDPYSVKMALHTIDSEVDFSDWCYLLAVSEKNFDEKGTFNPCKLLSPILLYLAEYKINNLIQYYGVNTMIEGTTLEELRSKIDTLITAIVQFISEQDRNYLIHRWVLYQFMEIRNKCILRTLEKQPDHVPDIHLYTHSKWILSYIKEKESFITYHDEKLEIWKDALEYEIWYQYVLFSMWGSEKAKDASSVANAFFDCWIFDTKTWYGNKGQIFRQQSEKFKFYGNYFENEENKYYYIAKLLFDSIQHNKSLDIWLKLLISSETSLDILIYQKYRSNICEYDNIQESTEFLKLLCIVGIHTLDILVQASHENTESFYHGLYDLIFKCYRTKYAKTDRLWLSFIKQLMLRRVLYSNGSNLSEFNILDTSRPKLSDYFLKISRQHIELFDALYFLHSNDVDKELIIKGLQEANVNLSEILKEYKRLNDLNEKNHNISRITQNIIELYANG